MVAPISDALVDVEALVEREGLLPFGLGLVRDVDAGLLTPEKVGTDRAEARSGQAIADIAHDLIDAEDLLNHDDPGAAAFRRHRQIGVEFPIVDFDLDLRPRHFSPAEHRFRTADISAGRTGSHESMGSSPKSAPSRTKSCFLVRVPPNPE